MAKSKTIYICQNCGTQSPKWVGRCTACNEWNTFVEEIVSTQPKSTQLRVSVAKPVLFSEISASEAMRIDLKNDELNRVLGGGLVQGSIVLVGGEPGIGKSTLMLQISLLLENNILYISGEESLQQIKLRAERISTKQNKNTLVLNETSLESIIQHIKEIKPEIVIIDSIQTVQTEMIESSPGSVSQVRECTSQIMKLAKESNTSIFIVGHINKDGNLAGPKVMEHMVDTVLQFEGDNNYNYRILRTLKNRFGSTSELGIFEMQNNGLREVSNPSELMLSDNNSSVSGTAVAATIEGLRPLLIEIQALVSHSAYGNPQRSATGYDLRRLSMLLAVLEKIGGLKLSIKDVFLNVVGGIKINDPAIDLAVVCSIVSSTLNLPIDRQTCVAGEVGLTGEIRPVNKIEQRIIEAEKLGFTRIFVSSQNKKSLNLKKVNINVVFVSKITEILQLLFK
ncbi:MAG TPA: DNA repair protein RadA [Bacteroidales bacterium]|nr:MAG: DNA repair protein RadA [Bacteroidetes bacterium GWF2_33_38]OFY72947.1 MAG: DNA repair protein RadA [Bacteroidetes bacterium RIFOXYA12_FULL_33_9]OFY92318.1 MAG: DNA repair protein RadA [Bacteroidetes bacterium RIFOXYA2_FULL_33_7]HBF87166.1 DNA repair protein RadA [Bacteroidales bacterium]